MTTTKRNIEAVLDDLGIKLPPACQAAGNYRPAVLAGNFLYVSGHTPDDARPEGFAVGKVRGSFASAVTNPALAALKPGRQLGTVKWFNSLKGYGFIQPADGGKDIFVLMAEVERSGLSTLIEGQKIEFEVCDVRGRKSAVNIKLADGTKPAPAPVPAGTVTPQKAYDAARDVGLAILSSVKAALGGDLNRVKRLVRATGVVNSAPDFAEHPKVMNGFSDLMAQVFGEENGIGARSATGAASLPGGVAVEVTEAIFEIYPARKSRKTSK